MNGFLFLLDLMYVAWAGGTSNTWVSGAISVVSGVKYGNVSTVVAVGSFLALAGIITGLAVGLVIIIITLNATVLTNQILDAFSSLQLLLWVVYGMMFTYLLAVSAPVWLAFPFGIGIIIPVGMTIAFVQAMISAVGTVASG